MRFRLPLWAAAVLPATLAGHAAAYAITGRSASGAAHEWMAPALESSLALLAFAVAASIGTALIRSGVFTDGPIDRSCWALWPRLAVAQAALFVFAERMEGSPVGFIGVAVQICIALIAAYVLSLFVHVVDACERLACDVSRYQQRTPSRLASLIPRCGTVPHFSLAVCAGTSRFQRPPPLRFI